MGKYLFIDLVQWLASENYGHYVNLAINNLLSSDVYRKQTFICVNIGDFRSTRGIFYATTYASLKYFLVLKLKYNWKKMIFYVSTLKCGL